jgi:hypothetical protein
MQSKLKICDNCKKLSIIWKSSGTGGMKLCKQCSYTGVAKPSNTKPTARQSIIPPRSQKRSKEERLYLAKRIIFLQENPMCQAHLPGICTKHATEVHHLYWGSSRSKHFLDFDNVKAICRSCHDYIHTKMSSEDAVNKGFRKIE